MDNDHIITPEGSGISRRQMLAGAGVLALGYGVGQMVTGPATAFGQDNLAPGAVATSTGLPFPAAWSTDQAAFNDACRRGAIRGSNQFKKGGGCGNGTAFGLLSVIIEDSIVADPTVYSPWEYLAPGIAAEIRSHLPGEVPVDLGSVTGNLGSVGIRGLNVGSTCGIAIGSAFVMDMALANSVVTVTGGPANFCAGVMRHFALDVHPNPAVGNASWFLEDPDKMKFAAPLDGPVEGMVYNTLECHAVVAKHRSRGQFIGGVTDPNLDQCRSEFCGRLVADMVYRTLSSVNVQKGGLAGEHSAANPGHIPVPGSCRTSGCHDTGVLPGGFTPQTDCFKCHQG